MQCSLIHFKFAYFLLAFLGLTSLLTLEPPSAQAQLPQSTLNFAPPPMDAPGNREAGGQRSDTCADTLGAGGLTALVPSTNIGLTTLASPDLFAYVPPNNAERAELRIIDEISGQEVYAGQVTLPENTETSSYQSPASILAIPTTGAITLDPGNRYVWALLLVCDSENRAQDIVVDVAVQRVGPDYYELLPAEISQELSSVDAAPQSMKLAIYGEAGIWQDFLSALHGLAVQDPALHQKTWVDVLSEQGLADLTSVAVFNSQLFPLAP